MELLFSKNPSCANKLANTNRNADTIYANTHTHNCREDTNPYLRTRYSDRRAIFDTNGVSHSVGNLDAFGNADSNFYSNVNRRRGSELVLDTVPKNDTDPLGWMRANVFNLGRKSKIARFMMANTLGPAADWLQTIPDPEVHPILAPIHHSIPEEGAVLMATALGTPGQMDEAILAVGLGIIVVGSLTFTYFSSKDYKLKGVSRLPPRLEPKPQLFERAIGSQSDPPEPPDKDPKDKKLQEVLSEILASKDVSLRAKLILTIVTVLGIHYQVSGLKWEKDNRAALELALTAIAPTPTDTPTPSQTTTLSPTETVTSTPTRTSTPTATDTETPIPTETATPTHTDSPSPTPTETPKP